MRHTRIVMLLVMAAAWCPHADVHAEPLGTAFTYQGQFKEGGVPASGADELAISRSTIDGGGVMFSTGGDFELSGTIGQPDAGVMEGGGFTLTGGFWFGEPPDDCNSDGWVDLIDYDDFEACLTGPNGGPLLPGCNCFDLDGDDDVDLTDVGRFQHVFTGG